MNIKWVGPVLDPSGYGNASRDYVSALYHSGHSITIETRYFNAKDPSLYNEAGELMQMLSDKIIDYDTVVHHYVPNKVTGRAEKGKFNVGYNTWETDKIPDHWVDQINNNFDLLLVPSIFNEQVYIHSGVTIPIEVVPHCVNTKEYENAPDYNEEYDLDYINGRYKFFSVFQWTERKNPIGLLKAYFSAFYNFYNDKVVLILKTYRSNTSLEEKLKIIEEIKKLKNDMNFNDQDKCPPILLLTDFVTKEDLITLYKMTDCFVLPTRGEGFGLPILEAMICGKPVITTNYGGHLDFCCERYTGENQYSIPKDKQLCRLIPYQLTPVAHMSWIPHYDGTQSWADPDVIELKRALQYNYFNIYPYDTKYAEKYIKTNYCYQTIAEKMINEILKYKP
jgi:hypothetical protein